MQSNSEQLAQEKEEFEEEHGEVRCFFKGKNGVKEMSKRVMQLRESIMKNFATF